MAVVRPSPPKAPALVPDPEVANEALEAVEEFESAPAPRQRNGQPLYLVGIGASAGGLEALRNLLSALPVNANMSYVIAQHLDPRHRSMLVTLLGRETALEVKAAENGERLEANRIYVCPANKDVTIKDGVVRLRKPRHAIGPKPSVDLFFTSLAEDAGEHAIGIILSGTGSDGAHGIRAIKAAGGITIAQDQESAKYNGMPMSAVATGAVDFVLPPEKIAKELPSITAFPRRLLQAQPTGKALSALDRILMLVKKRTDVDFSEYKASTVMRRINRRMAAHRIDTVEDYATFLEGAHDEVELLGKDIIISVTAFFRDKESFKALGRSIGQIVAEKKEGDSIRIWVPGCATGEEVYSIAILLAEELGTALDRYHVQIFGTDLDTEATITARRGLYPEAAVENLDDTLLNRYFVRMGNTYQVVKSLREITVFARQNLIKDPPFLRIDLVSCRNLLIYFTPALQKRIFELFHYVLRPGGFLFLGKSESVGQFTNLFDPINRKWRIFKRKGLPRTQFGGYSAAILKAVPELAGAREREREREPSIPELMYQVLIGAFAPPSVVVDSKYDVLHIHGDLTPYLRLSPGKAGLNLLTLANDELRPTLRALLHKALRETIVATSHRLRLAHDSDFGHLTVSVHPFTAEGNSAQNAVVSFRAVEAIEPAPTRADGEAAMDFRIAELEQELAATRCTAARI